MLLKMCRVCGKSNICSRSLNFFDLVNKKLLKHLHMITGLRMEAISTAPNFICWCCQSDLRSALAFRKLCIKSQRKWEEFLSSESESLESLKDQSKRKYINSTRLSDDDTKIPQETFQILIEEDSGNLNLISDSEGEETPDHWALPKSRRRKPKARSDDQLYICELCGSHATSKSLFERHMLRHTGERPFGCEDCAAGFLSAAELRAHRRVHTKDRPFACRFCERKYVSYMGRVKHERIHTNERPFVCAECGKTFTNAYILKNHMLIHSGDRRFTCDLCDRSFQRKTHLVTHFRSIAHQQNEEQL
ncbi:hypothetical protein KR009_003339 [Drosophila setifemur]|nr:hypothetical protein KR009_003339 [Drosophila setifemur]